MPEFEYKAVSRDEYKSGRLQAGSELEAQTMLSEQGLTVVSLRVRNPLEIGILTNFFIRLDRELNERMSVAEKILFTNQLSSMIKAGLPILDALSTFVDQKSATGSGRVISKIILEVQSGVKLSEAFARFPKIFPPAYLAVVRAGEGSGTLAESLGYLAMQLRRENELASKVRSALIYPIVVVTAMAAVMIFISVSIVPKILLFAQSSGQKLPGYTLALASTVAFFAEYWYLMLVLVGLSVVALIGFSRSSYGDRLLGRLSLRLPVVGPLVIRYNLARFSRVLGGFYIYGVEVVSSFDILAASLGNPLYRDACIRINDHLTAGKSLADAVFFEKELFPSIMTRLIRGAEKTGNLGNTLDRLAAYYEEELEVALRNLLSLIEPAMIFVLGFGVLGLALIVIVPIYKITSTLK
ncbi:hypothetical protein A3A84_01990 [Candidatus Collierbacteria bacterium RIFCSPLOWO2_01_FULL_50_23]|uniref:Type II secretion system protein GspF domain-containing protein n=2 Tax=Candidatus Collieribacteriota TaxID=1752725 RepID=A0A1F5EQX3_9BACT|nr:MAG: hypothetical protein A3D09_02515 [Candidatus Collierbacteria bacterium RIFCSPHIGHO2_02_FULL_49_10]OGD72381.1 MAG: hypothetical protein A2703_01565 [Candidatus Collierbacteria bacterium RIFCSPHIGHO2_01_FULL_50_25]OGD73738.1 MAG: hypothetical protein A3A84_01990 [Candidatus Collierbacteria bacterium RIFCSPLOWO2_01_FULL_50_23]